MKKIVYSYPKSSFLSAEKDMSIIVNAIMKNDRLKKLLYYTTRDCLERPILSDDETLELFGKNVKIVPKLEIDGEVLNYLIINFDKFVNNPTNPEFRNNIVEFFIICHRDQWHLKDFALRPYKMAAEIDTMFNNQHLTGIGTLEFQSASQVIVENEYFGLALKYLAIHGEEDKKGMPNPQDEKAFVEHYNAMFND